MRMPPTDRRHATLRVHGRLTRFIAPARRGIAFEITFDGRPAVKDPIEAVGVPHAEIGSLVIDGMRSALTRRIDGGESIDVHPVARQDAGTPPRFLLDVHLGRLAGDLRLAGIDTAYDPMLDDRGLRARAVAEGRVLLTRDTGLLKCRGLPAAAFVYATDPREQLAEVVRRFDLAPHARPFARCSRCNGEVQPVPAEAVAAQVPERVRSRVHDFSRCCGCGRIYWRGTHEAGIRARFEHAGLPS